eukprot:gene8732-10333_t
MYRFIKDWDTPVESWESLLQEIDRYKLPRRHMKVKTISEAKLTVLDNIHRLRGAGIIKRKRRAALECIEAVQNVFPQPKRKLVEIITVVCKMCGTLAPKPVFSVEEEKALRQKALRMYLILNEFAAHVEERFKLCMYAKLPVQNWEFLLDEIDNYKLPRRHMLMKTILHTKLCILHTIHIHRGAEVVKKKRRAALELMELLENVFPQPHDEVEEIMKFVWRLCGSQSFRSVLSLEEEKELLQKILRMHLILHGRDQRLVKEEQFLSDVLARLPQQQKEEQNNTEMCAFCGECSQNAAISLIQCTKCNNEVMYCSEGCRQSHAKVHAMVCQGEMTGM